MKCLQLLIHPYSLWSYTIAAIKNYDLTRFIEERGLNKTKTKQDICTRHPYFWTIWISSIQKGGKYSKNSIVYLLIVDFFFSSEFRQGKIPNLVLFLTQMH